MRAKWATAYNIRMDGRSTINPGYYVMITGDGHQEALRISAQRRPPEGSGMTETREALQESTAESSAIEE